MAECIAPHFFRVTPAAVSLALRVPFASAASVSLPPPRNSPPLCRVNAVLAGA